MAKLFSLVCGVLAAAVVITNTTAVPVNAATNWTSWERAGWSSNFEYSVGRGFDFGDGTYELFLKFRNQTPGNRTEYCAIKYRDKNSDLETWNIRVTVGAFETKDDLGDYVIGRRVVGVACQ